MCEESQPEFWGLRGGIRRPIDRKEVNPLSACPWDNGMGASVKGRPPMYLKGETDENGSAATSSLISIGNSRIPETVPTCLPGHELQAFEPGAEMPVFLDEEHSARLMKGMEQGGTATANIKGGDKVGKTASHPRGR